MVTVNITVKEDQPICSNFCQTLTLQNLATEYIVGQKRFAIQDIGYRWSGQVMEPSNSMAFIGYNPNDDGSNNIQVSSKDYFQVHTKDVYGKS